MSGTLCILGCRNFSREISAAIAAGGWDSVTAAFFPSRCGRPALSWDDITPLVPADCSSLLLLGSVCLDGLGEPPAGCVPVRVIRQKQCFHLLAGHELVDDLIGSGALLCSPGWLTEWQEHLGELGCTALQAQEVYHESANRVILLDSGMEPRCSELLAEFSAAVSLPAQRLAVGLDYLQQFLSVQVLQWRLEVQGRTAKERDRRHAAELADHVSAMDLLIRLARTEDEQAAVAAIEELFRMLFAPGEFLYVRGERGVPLLEEGITAEVAAAVTELQGDYAWCDDGSGFLLRIGYGSELLGVVVVRRLAFPEYRERYLNLALAVTGVCGLAVSNARSRKRLVEAEKMASLGMLVAGVAHEINTPLGVVLTASSAMQEQQQRLQKRFTERSMTQSDLERFLDVTGSSCALIRGNMERIARLTATFRKVAVAESQGGQQLVNMRDSIAGVVSSCADILADKPVSVSVECPSDIAISCLPSDWVTIFSNLISNSLRHGFREGRRGSIRISVAVAGDTLCVDYRDDGTGMTPETLARVFDPFFTTDIQHGMGLGMHLVYNIITHRFNGSISCASRPDEGVFFHIEVPL